MDWGPIIIAVTCLVIGYALGIVSAYFLKVLQAGNARKMAEELYRENESQREAQLNTVLESVRTSFGNLSLEALSKSTEEFLKLARQTLDAEREKSSDELTSKKGLIDQQLGKMTGELDKIAGLMNQLEKDREQKFGELASQLKNTSEQTASLAKTTSSLREALVSTRSRGQWGERMAEDVLRMSGLAENVNYLKQKTISEAGSRPDFTFLLPKDFKLNMDVKFPLDNYMRYLETDSETDKNTYKGMFLKDVRARAKEITSREYINPEQKTVDYVLLFIPNEQIYAFIHEQDSTILDESLQKRVIICSPTTLFAILVVIRQAIDNFALEQTSDEILTYMGRFKKQWDAYISKYELLGKRIEDVRKEYDLLTQRRTRALERPLTRIEELRNQKNLPIAEFEADEENNIDEQEEEPEVEND